MLRGVYYTGRISVGTRSRDVSAIRIPWVTEAYDSEVC